MFKSVDRVRPRWTNQDVAANQTEIPQPIDGAWRVWVKLRDWDQRFALVVDTTLAAALFILCSGWFAFSKLSAGDLLLAAGLTLPLIFRRRAPLVVFLVISAFAIVQWTTTGPMVADSALLVALYTVSAESDWIVVVVAGLSIEIGVVLATARWIPVGNYFKSLTFLTGMAAAALLAGVVVRELRSQMSWLAERAHRLEIERDQQTVLAAADERARIAREMHDVVSHNIQVMVTLADAAAVAQRTDQAGATEAMIEVSGTGRQALRDMRRLLGLLRQGEEKEEGVEGNGDVVQESLAPQPGLSELEALTKRVSSTGLAVTLDRIGVPFALSEAAELTVYRIIQEALTNTLKHAVAVQSVVISLSFCEPDVTVRVTDDGQQQSLSVSAEQDRPGGGHGILGMAERAAAFDGTLVAGRRAVDGWQVTATLRGCKAPVLI